jgi:hypothetical protein
MNNEVKYLKIEGVDRPFVLNILALRNFSKAQGIKRPSEIGAYFGSFDFNDPEWETLEVLASLVLCGLDAGARKDDTQQELNSDDVLEILSGDPSLIEAVFKDFAESMEVETDEKKTKPKKAKATA